MTCLTSLGHVNVCEELGLFEDISATLLGQEARQPASVRGWGTGLCLIGGNTWRKHCSCVYYLTVRLSLSGGVK